MDTPGQDLALAFGRRPGVLAGRGGGCGPGRRTDAGGGLSPSTPPPVNDRRTGV